MKNRKTLVSDGFNVPECLETEQFKLRMLTINDLAKDYEAVMSSVGHIRSTFSAISESDWPEQLALEDNFIDLGWHQREFTLRCSFAYTVVALDETRCLGCMHLNPSSKICYDVVISMWVRASELPNNLDSKLYRSVKTWINEDWPFSRPAYPGREVTIKEWNKIPNELDCSLCFIFLCKVIVIYKM